MSSSTFEDIKYEVDGHKATITLNRPNALNALSPHMISELRTAYDEAETTQRTALLPGSLQLHIQRQARRVVPLELVHIDRVRIS